MSQHNAPDSSHPSSIEHDSHNEAHVHGLRLVLGSILAPKRPSPPSHPGSHPVSGTASPLCNWHHPGTASGVGSGYGSATGHDTPPFPPPPPHSTPIVPHYQPQGHQSYQHAHQPTPTLHPHLNSHYHSHVHPQPQSHAHAHAYGPSRLSFTHSAGSTPPESLSPSPTPSPRLVTPPLTLDHAPQATYPHDHHAVGDTPMSKTPTSAHPDATDPKRAHFITTLKSKSAWDAMIHGSWV